MQEAYNFKNKYTTRPVDVRPGDAFAIKVVAVAHPGGATWAAYLGPSDWDDQQVADGGDSIKQIEAERLFPVMSDSHFRYEVQ